MTANNSELYNFPAFASPINGVPTVPPCCNAPIPVNLQIAKEYGFGVDTGTYPTLDQPCDIFTMQWRY